MRWYTSRINLQPQLPYRALAWSCVQPSFIVVKFGRWNLSFWKSWVHGLSHVMCFQFMGLRRVLSAPDAQCDREEYLRVSLIKSCFFVQHSGMLMYLFSFVYLHEGTKQGVSGERSGGPQPPRAFAGRASRPQRIFVCFVDWESYPRTTQRYAEAFICLHWGFRAKVMVREFVS